MTRYKAIGPKQVDEIASTYGLSAEQRASVELYSLVLPFRTNKYVLRELIDWSNVPEDPIFQLVFPQPGMLSEAHVSQLRAVMDAPIAQRAPVVASIRAAMNPHPSGQKELNVPKDEEGGEGLEGMQHKYAETVLYFPSQGQTCHAYCTYCFRWAQFVGDADLKFAAKSPEHLVTYVGKNPQVTDVLVTGGDPMIMSTERIASHIEPLLAVPTINTIRFGTKALGYWPQRFTTDDDADDLLRLFERVVASGRTLAVMAHFSHDRELQTAKVQRAIKRIRATGAVIYCQAPIMRNINDDARIWHSMWSTQLSLGAVPYYMFVARDTGPREYFEVPLARSARIFADAYRNLPGLARTVRGPVMSSTPGKIVIDGEVGQEPNGDHLLQARFLQARDVNLIGRPFTARCSEDAVWADQLRPVPGTPEDIVAALATTVSDDGMGTE